MNLYLLRHAIAEDQPGRPDSERELTEEGREKLAHVLERMCQAGIKPSVILTSPLVRAQQTAKAAADALGAEVAPLTVKELVPDATPSEAWASIRDFGPKEHVLAVSHEPLLSSLVAHILDAPALKVLMKKSAVVAIDVPHARATPHGTLRWMLTPKLAGGAKVLTDDDGL